MVSCGVGADGKSSRLEGDARGLSLVLGAGVTLSTLSIFSPFGVRFFSLLAGSIGAAVILFSALALGLRIHRSLCGDAAAGDVNEIFSAIVIGSGVFGCLIYGLAAFGLYRPWIGLALMASALWGGGGTSWRLLKSVVLDRPLLLWVAAPAWSSLLLAYGAPVIFWDSHAYHLAIPEIIHATGALPRGASYIYGYYPVANECLFALGWVFRAGEPIAQILNAAFLFLACAVAAEPLPPEERRLARTLLVSTPAIVMLAFLPKNTGLLALATIVACHHAMGDETRPCRPLLAGLALGTAAATHHAALILAPFLVAFLLRGCGWKKTAQAISLAFCIRWPACSRFMSAGMRNFSAPFFFEPSHLVG